MRVDLGLESLQLIGPVGQLQGVFPQNQLIQGLHHDPEAAGQDADFIIAFGFDLHMELAGLDLVDGGNQRLDRGGEADGDDDRRHNNNRQKQRVHPGIDPGQIPGVLIQVAVGNLLDHRPLHKRGLHLLVNGHAVEIRFLPLKAAVISGNLGEPAVSRFAAPFGGELAVHDCSVFIQNIQILILRIVQLGADPLQEIQTQIH
ncbi:hypothetical protein D3C75_540350 [compost metagenome]